MAYTYPNSMHDAILIGIEKSINAAMLAGIIIIAGVSLHLICIFPGLPRAISTGDSIFVALFVCLASMFYEAITAAMSNPVETAEQLKLMLTVSSIRGYVLTIILVLVMRVSSVFGESKAESKVETAGAKESTSAKKDA